MSLADVRVLVGLEGRKALRLPTTWILGLVLGTLLVMMAVSFATLFTATPQEGFDTGGFLDAIRQDALGFGVELYAGLASLLLVVFAATLVGQEFSRGTLRTLLLNRASRQDVARSKLVFLVMVSLLLALAGLVVAVALAGVLGLAVGEDLLRFGERSASALLGDLAWRAAAMTVGFAVWALVAFALTLWTKSLGAGIGATLALLIAGDGISGLLAAAGDIGLYAARTMPNVALTALSGPDVPGRGTWAWVLPNLLAYGALLPWLAMRRFRRMDVLAATK